MGVSLGVALRRVKGGLWSVGLFSCAINLLMLTGPIFMLQVYDRVLASRSVPTLVVLFALVAALYGFMAIFEILRTKILSRLGYRVDADLRGAAYQLSIHSSVGSDKSREKPLNDLATLRQFMGGKALVALFDMPWVPVYLAVVFLLHQWLGWLATAGALLVVVLAVGNEVLTRKHIARGTRSELQQTAFAEHNIRNADTIIAMGMLENIGTHWQKLRDAALADGQKAADQNGWIHSVTKSMRLLLQSGMLALGAYLAIFQEITPGTMIAASILAGRALAPVDMAIANWRGFIQARQAYGRLHDGLSRNSKAIVGDAPMELPEPVGKLSTTNLLLMRKGDSGDAEKPLLQRINIQLDPGDGLGVIGPSGSGKSCLARILTGIWQPDRGEVRLDGAKLDQWNRGQLGRHVGYLPQAIELFPGTIRQNIARFDDSVGDEEILAAARLADVHQLILQLPDGYQTKIGIEGTQLSGGQVQRVALARAVLRMPPVIVLDEPNANLDAEGDQALGNAIAELRKAGSTVIVMAHRPSAIASVNKILMLRDGKQVKFGEKDAVLKKVTRPVDTRPNLAAVQAS